MIGTRNWINGLDLPVKQHWRPWRSTTGQVPPALPAAAVACFAHAMYATRCRARLSDQPVDRQPSSMDVQSLPSQQLALPATCAPHTPPGRRLDGGAQGADLCLCAGCGSHGEAAAPSRGEQGRIRQDTFSTRRCVPRACSSQPPLTPTPAVLLAMAACVPQVPYTQPERALYLFSKWVHQQPL